MPICPACHERIPSPTSPAADKIDCPACGARLRGSELGLVPDILPIRSWYALPKWLRICLSVGFWLALFFSLPQVFAFFSLHTRVLIVIWLSVPVILYFAYLVKTYQVLDYHWARVLRVCFITVEIAIGFLIFLNRGHYVDGELTGHYLFENPSGWLIDVVAIISAIIVPIITWSIATRILKRVPDYERLHNG